MKEHLYAWYPSARNVYNTCPYDSYDLECLYKYRKTTISLKAEPIRQTITTRYDIVSKPLAGLLDFEDDDDTKRAEPAPPTKPDPEVKSRKPLKAWGTKTTAATPHEIPPKLPRPRSALAPLRPQEEPYEPSRDMKTAPAGQMPRDLDLTLTGKALSREQKIKYSPTSLRMKRAQSAPPKTPAHLPVAKRPAKSATTRTRKPWLAVESKKVDPAEDEDRVVTPLAEDVIVTEEDKRFVEDYEKLVKKYGWRMEIPGNSFGFKKFPKRLPYTVRLTIPDVPVESPMYYTQNCDTFYYNTIPRRPISFEIGQDWPSETIHHKRMALLKKKGLYYKYTNFSFVY